VAGRTERAEVSRGSRGSAGSGEEGIVSSAATAVDRLNLTSADLQRFRSFRIPDDLLNLHGVRRVTDAEARLDCGILYKDDVSGVSYPIFGPDGTIKGYRVRRDNPELEGGKPKAKYVQSIDRPHLYFERSTRQYLSDASVPVVFVEAYTSALAIAALCLRTGRQYLIVATAGCWGWRGTIGKAENEDGGRVDEKGPSPDLDHIAWTGRKTIICLDSNVESNSKVQAAERAFKRELERRGANVHLARIPQENGINGPDDFIARHSDEDFLRIIDAADYEAWPEPQPVREELSPVHTLPAALIPAPLEGWLTDIARRMQCPIDFVTVAAIVVLSSVIGAGCGIRPKRRDDWIVIPNLWGGVIGPPSLMLKSPALAEAMRPLNRLEVEAHEQHKDAWKSHEAELEMFKARKDAIRDDMRSAAKGKKRGDQNIDAAAAKNDYASLEEPSAPTCRRYVSNDSTVEKLSEILSENSRGILLFRDELIGLLASWDREGHESDRAFFLEGWKGDGSHKTDRIGRGTIFTPRVCISILGGIQPSKLTGYLYAAMRGNDNDGLVQRLQLAVYPDVPPAAELVDQYPDAKAKNRAYDIIRKLAEADFLQLGAMLSEDTDGIPYYRFDDAAQELFYEWFNDLTLKLRKEDDEPIVTEHLGKYRSLMPSLALIFHLVDLADGRPSGPVSEDATKKAVLWCGYLEEHARRIYGLVTKIHVRAAARLAKKIKSGDLPNPFTVRDVYRKEWSLLDDKEIAQAACDELVDLGWLREYRPENLVGRPRLTEYDINPRVRRYA